MARLGVSFSNLFRDGSRGGCRVHGVCIPPPAPPPPPPPPPPPRDHLWLCDTTGIVY